MICSDLFKAIWYFISSALALKLNPDRFGHDFCQVSGFFLAFGVEASDYAILVIAVHSVLCIFRPRTNLGEAGLFGIRYSIYGLWIALPLLAAGLGLLHGGVYIDTGAFCWLPIRPFYYRLALSWIPRYIIFITILILYARIYWFVNSNFKIFHSSTGDSYRKPSELAYGFNSRSRRASSQLVGPKSFSNDAANLREDSDHAINELKDVSTSCSRRDPANNDHTSPNSPSWENYTFGSTTIPLPGPKLDEITLAPSQGDIEALRKGSVCTQKTSTSDSPNEEVSKSLAEFLKEPPPEGMIATSKLDPMLVTEEVDNETRARRTAIKRQLRFMFVYPLFYLISWIPPLVQHFTLYDDDIASHPSFTLACVSTVFVALQCFMDSAIFCYRETPWRYVRKDTNLSGTDRNQTNGNVPYSSGWISFRWKHQSENSNTGSGTDDTTSGTLLNSRNTTNDNTPRSSFINRVGTVFQTSSESNTHNRLSSTSGKFFLKSPPGKSRGERIAEARAARHRRDLEESIAREGQEERQRQRKDSALRRDGADRSWWEVEGRQRNDSVLLGLDQESSSSKTKGCAFPENIDSPTSHLFSPRGFSGTTVNTPDELSSQARPPMSPEENSAVNDNRHVKPEIRTERAPSDLPISASEMRRSMPTVKEEDIQVMK